MSWCRPTKLNFDVITGGVEQLAIEMVMIRSSLSVQVNRSIRAIVVITSGRGLMNSNMKI